jgi:hypothetical protein
MFDRADEISQRLGRLDFRPDPDGRYRVNEVYCRDDTWRPALEALLESCDTVLMDLRTFRRAPGDARLTREGLQF